MTDKFIIKCTKKIKKASFTELTEDEIEQLLSYLWIFISENFEEHWQVNNYITEHDIWDEFTAIRSLNDHGHRQKIKGITPKHFAIACKVLDIDADDGAPLRDYLKY